MRLQYHTRNIQRIEDGLHQPGMLLARRMVTVVDADSGEFIKALFEEAASSVRDGAASAHKGVSVTYQPLEAVDGVKSIYGPLLAQARLAVGMSQTATAKSAGYNLRNINGWKRARGA